VPDFTTKKVDIDYHQVANGLMKEERVVTKGRK